MSEVKSDVPGLEVTADVKTERILKYFKVDAVNEVIPVVYDEVKYYMDGSDKVVVSTETKSYNGDYAEWLDSDAGIAIKEAIEGKLQQNDPSV